MRRDTGKDRITVVDRRPSSQRLSASPDQRGRQQHGGQIFTELLINYINYISVCSAAAEYTPSLASSVELKRWLEPTTSPRGNNPSLAPRKSFDILALYKSDYYYYYYYNRQQDAMLPS